ncbi:MAG: response regulator transcription factor [Chloroflexia bacterium]|nr:response regulator transcription factor [Chloroflexia bacterium]
MIRVLICDDQVIVCEGLRAILGAAPDIEIVGLAHDGAEALELVAQHRPDVVLMDLNMPGVNGIQATRQIGECYPGVRVLVLTTYDADEWVLDAVRSGAAGYLLKDTPRQDLLEAIRDTAAGRSPVDPAVAGKLMAQVARVAPPPVSTIADQLTPRELDVLRLLGRGLSNADIARRLYLSEGTVRNYVSEILSKLGLSDRTQAAVLALRHGLVDQD